MASILIVDDDPDGSEPVARFLRKSGYRVVTVPNGREALSMLTGALPDLIILDMRMPEMDGAHFLEVLRSYLRWQDVPVILVTAYPEDPGIAHAAELGVTEVFRKGDLDLEELVATVERKLGGGPRPPGAAMDIGFRPPAHA
jgi:CheY-like chemotaxis protein